jgi:hypothetical protein
MTIDYENQFHEVELADGRRARDSFSARTADRPMELKRETFAFSTGLLAIVLPAGTRSSSRSEPATLSPTKLGGRSSISTKPLGDAHPGQVGARTDQLARGA